jgi:hypothetical protein
VRDFERLVRCLHEIFQGDIPQLREIRQLFGVDRLLKGEPLEAVSADSQLQRRGLEAVLQRVREQGLAGFIDYADLITDAEITRRRLGIAQMLLGVLAERRFEGLITEITGGGIVRVEDHRPSRSDTDYRLLNGNSNPICRLNIKFHGSLFRESRRYVGLAPEDCFALATYKINNALKRQDEEKLPYVFLVLSVPDLSAAEVARLVPDDYVWALATLGGRRFLEEAIVERLLSSDHAVRFGPILRKMPEGQFRTISAKKAANLLQAKLFERVHALSLKGFIRRFRNAEVDMHFSLADELTPVRTFLELLVKESPQKFAVRLYIGDY